MAEHYHPRPQLDYGVVRCVIALIAFRVACQQIDSVTLNPIQNAGCVRVDYNDWNAVIFALEAIHEACRLSKKWNDWDGAFQQSKTHDSCNQCHRFVGFRRCEFGITLFMLLSAAVQTFGYPLSPEAYAMLRFVAWIAQLYRVGQCLQCAVTIG